MIFFFFFSSDVDISFLRPVWWFIPRLLQFITRKLIQSLAIMIIRHIWVEHVRWPMIQSHCHHQHYRRPFRSWATVTSFKRPPMDFSLFLMPSRKYRKHKIALHRIMTQLLSFALKRIHRIRNKKKREKYRQLIGNINCRLREKKKEHEKKKSYLYNTNK